MIVQGGKPDQWALKCDGCGVKSAEVASAHQPATITVEGWMEKNGVHMCPVCVDKAQSGPDDDADAELDV